jgi:predicted phosphodiesterase
MNNEPSLQRIGVIGDIHAEDHYLQATLEFLTGANLDRIMAVGDIADGPGSVDRCCQLLRQYCVAAVVGNHERWLLAGEARDLPEATAIDEVSRETRAYLSALPKTREFQTVAGRLLLCHGLGEYDMGGVWPGDYGYALESNLALLRLLLEAKYQYVVNGHTHHRMVRNFDRLTIINAGTLFHKHAPCFVVADFAAGAVHYFNLKRGGRIVAGEVVRLSAGG